MLTAIFRCGQSGGAGADTRLVLVRATPSWRCQPKSAASAPTDPRRVFSLAGDYLYNVLEPPADVADLLRRIRKAAAAQLSATGGSDPQI